MFNHQKALADDLLMKLQFQPFASNTVLNALLGEFTNLDSIYQLYKLTIQMAIQLHWTQPVLDRLSSADHSLPKRSLLPFLGDALQWLTGTATLRDMTEIKWQINLLVQEKTKQQEALVHIISILNVTWYEDVNILFNITDVVRQHLRYHQIYTYAHTLLTDLRDSLIYMS